MVRSFRAGWAAGLLVTLAGYTAGDVGAQSRLSSGSAFTVDDVLDVRNLSIEDVSASGAWIAVSTTSLRDRIGVDNYRSGDPTYVGPRLSRLWSVDGRSGERREVFEQPVQLGGMAWSPEEDRLALVVRTDEAFEVVVWNRESGALRPLALPEGAEPVIGGGGADPRWSSDGRSVYLAVRPPGWAERAHEEFQSLTEGPIVALSSERPFLAWEALAARRYDQAIVALDVAGGDPREIVPSAPILSYDVSPDGRWLRYTEFTDTATDYDSNRGSDGRIHVVDLSSGRSTILAEPEDELDPTWAADGVTFAFTRSDSLFVGDVSEDREPRFVALFDGEDDAEDSGEGRLSLIGLGPTGRRLIASGRGSLWYVDARDGTRTRIAELPERRPRSRLPQLYQVADWSPDGEAVYLRYAAQDRWERGVSRFEFGSGTLTPVYRTEEIIGDLEMSSDGSSFVIAGAPGNRPNVLQVADSGFENVRILFDPNPDLSRKSLSSTELVHYRDVDGTELFGVVYHPIGYREGQRYPTVFLVYEDFFDDRFNATVQVLTNQGYVVVNPSVKFETGHPEEAWLKGVTAAANRLIDLGIADPDRLGVHGTSYGGYATNLLITQTDRFKAAINISGKVNMVSFYTDSPRIGIRNIRAPEWGQDRVGATLWEQPQKYIATSAIMDADRIDTPLLLMTGRQDHNVPARQAMEMYYALRRLGKHVEWVEYVHGGHGMPTTTVEEVEDYHRRILQWYDRFLKGGDTAEVTSSSANPAR